MYSHIENETRYDVIVIGAGLQGLAAAKTYLKIEPQTNLLIIDSNQTVGGVWAKENIYPGLRSNNLLGTYEYTDFPMHENFGVQKEEHIPGGTNYEYFRQYAERFDLTRRTLLRSKLTTAEKVEDGWNLSITTVGKPADQTSNITCSKLVVATGVTSSPVPIDIEGQENFSVPVLNFAHFRHEAAGLLKNPSIEHVAVYGGAKAAYDTVYMLASHGKRVSWIIRASGHGPTYMAPAHVYLGPFRCWLEKLTAVRFLTFFSPCVWGGFDGFGYLRSLMHGTKVGRKIVDIFWQKLTQETISQSGLNDHDEFKKLIPDQPAFWYANGLSILNYPTNILDFVKSGQVTVIRQDVERLAYPRSIRFRDGTCLDVDALICSMGWQHAPSINFLPSNIHAKLGIPSGSYNKAEKQLWDNLDRRADLEILSRFPYLATGPKVDPKTTAIKENLSPMPSAIEAKKVSKEQFTPWRLSRGIAPPDLADRSIVFLGMMLNLHSSLRSEISSIWAYAYMNDRLKTPLASISISASPRDCPNDEPRGKSSASAEKSLYNDQDCLYETALFNRFGRWRYPMGYGARFPDFVFDGVPYLDLLLHDLGLCSWRKGWGWFGELFGGSYGQADYRGLVAEWVDSQRKV